MFIFRRWPVGWLKSRRFSITTFFWVHNLVMAPCSICFQSTYIWSPTLSCSLQISGQRLAYRFGKLPYKYEPGVTRSRRHGHRLKACIQQHMPQTSSSSRQINPCSSSSSISNVSTSPLNEPPVRAVPSHPISWYLGPMPPISDCSESRIMFPPFAVDPVISSSSSPVSFLLNDPIESFSPALVQERTRKLKSIAVPVIKWI